jgi:integrase
MALAQFKLCMNAAVREGLIRANPASDARAPSQRRKRVTLSDVLDAHEVDLLTKATPDHWKALVFLSAWLGWRWSEAMGLRWRDVDLENGLAYVGNETIVESQGRLHLRCGGKTDAATRVVPLPSVAVDVLRWHRERSAVDPAGSRRVFVTAPCPPTGKHAVVGRKGGCEVKGMCHGHTPLRSNFRRVFVKAVKDAGLEGRGINVRQLRHTAASLMLSNGLDVLDVQDRLGHSRGSVTLDIYGRVLAGRRNASTTLLNSAMSVVSDLSFIADGSPLCD